MDIFYIFLAILVGAGIGIIGANLVLKSKEFKVEKLNSEIREQNIKFKQETEQLVSERRIYLNELENEASIRRNQLEQQISQQQNITETLIEQQQEQVLNAFIQYVDSLDIAYTEKEEDFDLKIAALQEELEKLRSARVANIQAALREKELKEQENFYKVSISDSDIADITILEEIKPRLRRPDVLSKLIWTTYYQKGLNSLCSNVLGNEIVCGIYKITNCTTGEVYIGQSVNVAQRWKDHVKAALGATATVASNKLYSSMRDCGVHNFTFEILEKTPATQLNEKEKYYIDFYQSDRYGLNVVKGVGK